MQSPSAQANHRKFVIDFVWPLVLTLLFAICWGGLTFYALIVVPIGSNVTSSVEQGFVTQRVTFWHNLLLTLLTCCVFAEALFRQSLRWWLLFASMFSVNAALLWMHWKLSGMIDAAELSVPSEFYRMHAIYLWLTTAEWLIGLTGIILSVYETAVLRLEKSSAGGKA